MLGADAVENANNFANISGIMCANGSLMIPGQLNLKTNADIRFHCDLSQIRYGTVQEISARLTDRVNAFLGTCLDYESR